MCISCKIMIMTWDISIRLVLWLQKITIMCKIKFSIVAHADKIERTSDVRLAQWNIFLLIFSGLFKFFEFPFFIASILIECHTKPLLLFWYLRAWQNWMSSAAWTQKLGCAFSSKEHTLYLSFLGPNNPPLSSPKFGSCL